MAGGVRARRGSACAASASAKKRRFGRWAPTRSTTQRDLGALRTRKPGASLSSVRARSSGFKDRTKEPINRRWAIMDVYEAVTSRRAVRGFTDEPVSREVLERVLSAAAWSPSGSNLQPWNSYVLTGALLAELKTRAVERVAHGDPWDEREYEMYPRALKSPYGERRSAFGKERYSALGCESAPNRDPAPAQVTTLIRLREPAEQEGPDRRR